MSLNKPELLRLVFDDSAKAYLHDLSEPTSNVELFVVELMNFVFLQNKFTLLIEDESPSIIFGNCLIISLLQPVYELLEGSLTFIDSANAKHVRQRDNARSAMATVGVG